MNAPEAITHPDSLRGLAYEVLNQLYGASPVDDSNITIYQIEAELRHQYGLLIDKDDLGRLRAGQRPEASRIVTRSVTLLENSCEDCTPELRTAPLPEYISWNGQPYITNVSACGINFVPVDHVWQLRIKSNQLRRPTYAIESDGLKLFMTPQTVAVESIEVTGAYKDPFFGLERNDPAFWQKPWGISEAYKAQIKERAEIRLRGGSVATWNRADKKNNGVETPVNNPQT